LEKIKREVEKEILKTMTDNLNLINSTVYKKCKLSISNFEKETESKEYNAFRFELNGLKIVYRKAKVTPKKIGQFVTFWKRNKNGIIEPLDETDPINFYVITVEAEKKAGQFIFPKSILIKKGIISTNKKEGKRGFRVYPLWDEPKSNQAIKTQKWQLDYFYEAEEKTDLNKIIKLFKLD